MALKFFDRKRDLYKVHAYMLIICNFLIHFIADFRDDFFEIEIPTKC